MTESALAIETTVLTADSRLEALADGWDRLPPGRGLQADLYDSHAWLSAWLAAAPDEQREALRVPVVLLDGDVVGALPLVVSGQQARAAGHGFRPRYRPVVAGAEPDKQILEALAEEVARAGYRELSLFAMPSRDPATAGLAAALESRGYTVRLREGSAECLASAAEGWKAFRSGAKKFHRTVKNFSNKAARLGPVEIEAWEAPGKGAAEGFARYVALHGKGWKGELNPAMHRHRRALLERTDALGWSRLYLLKVAGVDAAAILWQRIGSVAIAYSTVYDHRLAALSAGTIVMWQAHERVFEQQPPPELVDYLPGRGAQKDQLATERPVLLTLEAARSRLVAAVGPLGDGLRRAAGRALRQMRGGSEKGSSAKASCRSLSATVEAGRAALAPLEPEGALELYLAVAGGHSSPKKMRESWGAADRWWQVDDPAGAFVRTTGDQHPEVAEIVLLPGIGLDAQQVLDALAAHFAVPLAVQLFEGTGPAPARATRLLRAVLPWPPP